MKNLLSKTILIILIGIVSFGFFGFEYFKNYARKVKDQHCFSTQISSRLLDFNSFIIVSSSALDINEFKVVQKNSGNIIFENGLYQKGMKNEYGRCSFYLFWKNEPVYSFSHFKKNNWHTNDYQLHIGFENNQLNPNLEIKGPDSLKFQLEFNSLELVK